MNNYIIYKHTSPSGKSYIGLTNDYERRCKEHIRVKHKNRFQSAILKYGWDNFTHEILAVGLSLQAANHFEEFYISFYGTFHPNGYNLTTGGKCAKLSEESIKKRGSKLKGRKRTKEQIEKTRQSNLGRKHTPEHIEKRMIHIRGKKHTDSAKLKMSEHKKTPEHIEKVRLANLGRIVSDETKALLRAKNLGKTLSEETRLKMSAGLKGKTHSEDRKRANSIRQWSVSFAKELEIYENIISKQPLNKFFAVLELSELLQVSRKSINTRVLNGYYPNKIIDPRKKRKVLIPKTDVDFYYAKGVFRYA
jgi:group I intron endonuclease